MISVMIKLLRVSVEVARQAKREEGLDESEDRHKPEPATEAQPTPTANGARVRSAAISIVGMWKLLAAVHAMSECLT